MLHPIVLVKIFILIQLSYRIFALDDSANVTETGDEESSGEKWVESTENLPLFDQSAGEILAHGDTAFSKEIKMEDMPIPLLESATTITTPELIRNKISTSEEYSPDTDSNVLRNDDQIIWEGIDTSIPKVNKAELAHTKPTQLPANVESTTKSDMLEQKNSSSEKSTTDSPTNKIAAKRSVLHAPLIRSGVHPLDSNTNYGTLRPLGSSCIGSNQLGLSCSPFYQPSPCSSTLQQYSHNSAPTMFAYNAYDNQQHVLPYYRTALNYNAPLENHAEPSEVTVSVSQKASNRTNTSGHKEHGRPEEKHRSSDTPRSENLEMAYLQTETDEDRISEAYRSMYAAHGSYSPPDEAVSPFIYTGPTNSIYSIRNSVAATPPSHGYSVSTESTAIYSDNYYGSDYGYALQNRPYEQHAIPISSEYPDAHSAYSQPPTYSNYQIPKSTVTCGGHTNFGCTPIYQHVPCSASAYSAYSRTFN